MKVGVIGAGTMGQGIAKAFAMVDGYTVALCVYFPAHQAGMGRRRKRQDC